MFVEICMQINSVQSCTRASFWSPNPTWAWNHKSEPGAIPTFIFEARFRPESWINRVSQEKHNCRVSKTQCTGLLWKIHIKYHAFSSFKTRWKMQKFFRLLISNLGFTKYPSPRRTGRKQLSARPGVVFITHAVASAYPTVLKACNAWLIGWPLTLTTYKVTLMIFLSSQQRRKSTYHISGNCFKSSMMLVLKSIPKRPS